MNGFHATILHCKAKLVLVQPGLVIWILLWLMPLVQYESIDLLTSSPAHYQYVTDAPLLKKHGVSFSKFVF